MGQKTEFNLDDWDFPEEKSNSSDSTSEWSDTDFASDFEEDFSLLEQSIESSAETNESSEEITQKAGESFVEEDSDSDEMNIVINETKSLFEVHGNKLQISGSDNNKKELTQEEEAFKRQIEDLFELLEMEKSADKNDGIRVYQTDSSPSRPWRFH